MSLAFCPLRSGSSGNSLFVSDGKTNLLFDAAFPAARWSKRCMI